MKVVVALVLLLVGISSSLTLNREDIEERSIEEKRRLSWPREEWTTAGPDNENQTQHSNTTSWPDYHQEVRLVNGTGSQEDDIFSGRVEVRNNSGIWGTVCDDSFNDVEALVICRSFGFNHGRSKGHAYFGQGEGDIFMDDLKCTGNERSIFDCPHRGWGEHNCGHYEDAGVVCTHNSTEESTTVWPDYPHTTEIPQNATEIPQNDTEIRLTNGRGSPRHDFFSGRVEVRSNNGSWGTVCDDEFGHEEAEVICRGFGFDYGQPRKRAFFGRGVGPIFMDNLNCTGHESSIFECPYNGWGNHNCRHGEDAGVVCTRHNESTTAWPDYGHSTEWPDYGHSTEWPDYWHSTEWPDYGHTTEWPDYGTTESPIIEEGEVFGKAEQLLAKLTKEIQDVQKEEDRVKTLEQIVEDELHPVRLIGRYGRQSNVEGRLEVFVNGVWGTVCDDGQERKHTMAYVVCRMLGTHGGRAIQGGAHRFHGTKLPIVMDDVNCQGHERSIHDCPRRTTGHNCGHSEDVAIRCGF